MTEAIIAIAIAAAQLTAVVTHHREHDDTERQVHKYETAKDIEHSLWHKAEEERLEAERKRRAAAVAAAGFGKWDPILQCESGGDWYISRGLYEGGLQFHPGTWDAYKPAGYPDAAYQATPAQQILVAERVLADQGWGAWPACSRKAGYR